jgi:hypothetical protein
MRSAGRNGLIHPSGVLLPTGLTLRMQVRQQMTQWQLAELNLAKMTMPLEAPGMADFVDNLERVNALAESSPGFIWRLQDEAGDATALRPFGEDILVNLSVWADLDALRDFVFRSAHSGFMRRRSEWFAKMDDAYLVLWWVPCGHQPNETEAWERLEHLREQGPGPQAFGFRQTFAHP